MATIRRWGAFRTAEARLERTYGPQIAETVLASGYGIKDPTPIMGFPAYTYDGCLIPRVGGGAGFVDIADMKAKYLGGRGQVFRVDKTGFAYGANTRAARHFWARNNLPVPGTNASTGTVGQVFTNADVGGLQQKDPWAGETLHFAGCIGMHTAFASVIMFDYTYGLNVDLTSAGATITGAPTRWTGTNARGSWIGTRITTALGSVSAPVITVTFTDDTGATGQTTVGLTAEVSGPVHSPIQTTSQDGWVFDLNGKQGIRAMTAWASSLTTNTGNFDFMIGHNLVCIPCYNNVPNGVGGALPMMYDGWESVFNFVAIPNGANLAFMEIQKTPSTAGSANLENLILLASG